MRRLPALAVALMIGATPVLAPALSPAPARAATGMIWPIGPSPSSESDRQPCASVLFVGVRGSGEPVPYGDTVTRVRNNVKSATATLDGTVRELWVDYPAADPHTLSSLPVDQLLLADALPDSTYFRSVADGAKELGRVLADSATRCPSERVVVAGFSQGAEVVTTALASADPTRFAGVVVAGNPANSPALPGGRTATAKPGAFGLTASLFYLRAAVASNREVGGNEVGAAVAAALQLQDRSVDDALVARAAHGEGTRVPAALGEALQTVCLDGDLACDAGPALARIMSTTTTMTGEIDATRVIHLSYNENVLRPATDVVAQRIAEQARPPQQGDNPVLAPAAAWRQWLPLAGFGLFAGGVGAGLLLARAGRRRRAG